MTKAREPLLATFPKNMLNKSSGLNSASKACEPLYPDLAAKFWKGDALACDLAPLASESIPYKSYADFLSGSPKTEKACPMAQGEIPKVPKDTFESLVCSWSATLVGMKLQRQLFLSAKDVPCDIPF